MVIVKPVRLFSARPTSVSLLATGFVAPKPMVLIRSLLMPPAIKYCAMAWARCEERAKLKVGVPVLSVCPSIKIEAVGVVFK